MNRVVREQRRCKELREERKHRAWLEKRLDAAEALVTAQDRQVGDLVQSLGAVVNRLIELKSPEMLSTYALTNALWILDKYKDPEERIEDNRPQTDG